MWSTSPIEPGTLAHPEVWDAPRMEDTPAAPGEDHCRIAVHVKRARRVASPIPYKLGPLVKARSTDGVDDPGVTVPRARISATRTRPSAWLSHRPSASCTPSSPLRGVLEEGGKLDPHMKWKTSFARLQHGAGADPAHLGARGLILASRSVV